MKRYLIPKDAIIYTPTELRSVLSQVYLKPEEYQAVMDTVAASLGNKATEENVIDAMMASVYKHDIEGPVGTWLSDRPSYAYPSNNITQQLAGKDMLVMTDNGPVNMNHAIAADFGKRHGGPGAVAGWGDAGDYFTVAGATMSNLAKGKSFSEAYQDARVGYFPNEQKAGNDVGISLMNRNVPLRDFVSKGNLDNEVSKVDVYKDNPWTSVTPDGRKVKLGMTAKDLGMTEAAFEEMNMRMNSPVIAKWKNGIPYDKDGNEVPLTASTGKAGALQGITPKSYRVGSTLTAPAMISTGAQLLAGKDPEKVAGGIALREGINYGVSNLGDNFYNTNTGKFTNVGSSATSGATAGALTYLNTGDAGKSARNAAYAAGSKYATNTIASKFGSGYGGAAGAVFSLGSSFMNNGNMTKQQKTEAVQDAIVAAIPYGWVYSIAKGLAKTFLPEHRNLNATPIWSDGSYGRMVKDKNGNWVFPGEVTGYKEDYGLGLAKGHNIYNKVYQERLNQERAKDPEFAAAFDRLASNYENRGQKGWYSSPNIGIGKDDDKWNPVEDANNSIEKLKKDILKAKVAGANMSEKNPMGYEGLRHYYEQSKNETDTEYLQRMRSRGEYKFISAVSGKDSIKTRLKKINDEKRINDIYNKRYDNGGSDSTNQSIIDREKAAIAKELGLSYTPKMTSNSSSALSWIRGGGGDDSNW